MIWPVFLSLFWAAIATTYVSVVRREAELLFAGISLLSWLGVAFSSTSIQIAVGDTLETVGEPGLTAIGVFGVIGMMIWIILVVADRVPTGIDNQPDSTENDTDGIQY